MQKMYLKILNKTTHGDSTEYNTSKIDPTSSCYHTIDPCSQLTGNCSLHYTIQRDIYG